jgi:transposase
MLCLILIVGGLLIMMRQHNRSEALFYYFRLEDQVPETHRLRLIEQHISFELVRERLRNRYRETGRPSIDPELLLGILLIGYLYGITRERKRVEELRMHLAWRWFTGLGFDQEIPHHSTFWKSRHGRFQESKLFEELFEQIVLQCVEVGWVQGKHLSVDGSFVEANAAQESRIPREQLAEAVELEQQNPAEEPAHQQGQVSTTDPDASYATKGGTPARLGYYDNDLVEPELRNRGSTSDGSTDESGNGGRAGHARSLLAMARTRARIGSGRPTGTGSSCNGWRIGASRPLAKAQRERKKVEALFPELKNQIGLRRLRLRRLKFVQEQFSLAALAQNIKRLVRFLSQPTTPTMEAAP